MPGGYQKRAGLMSGERRVGLEQWSGQDLVWGTQEQVVQGCGEDTLPWRGRSVEGMWKESFQVDSFHMLSTLLTASFGWVGVGQAFGDGQ